MEIEGCVRGVIVSSPAINVCAYLVSVVFGLCVSVSVSVSVFACGVCVCVFACLCMCVFDCMR